MSDVDPLCPQCNTYHVVPQLKKFNVCAVCLRPHMHPKGEHVCQYCGCTTWNISLQREKVCVLCKKQWIKHYVPFDPIPREDKD
jgi:hypothetical protein